MLMALRHMNLSADQLRKVLGVVQRYSRAVLVSLGDILRRMLAGTFRPWT